MKELKHLEDIFENYDTFVIDLWGVMHNGVVLNPKAIEAVDQLKKNLKKIVFLSNAPRPSSKVINFLLKMKMDKKFLEHVMTSGEAAMHAINQKKFGKTFFSKLLKHFKHFKIFKTAIMFLKYCIGPDVDSPQVLYVLSEINEDKYLFQK